MRHTVNWIISLCTQYIIYSNLVYGSDFPNSDICGGGTFMNVDNGVISPPLSFMDPLLCTWILNAPPGHKLLVNINQIYLPSPSDVLHVSIDSKNVNLSRKCDKCVSNLVGESLNVTYEFDTSRYANYTFDDEEEKMEENYFNETEVNFTSSISFHIFYESFDPKSCVSMKIPSNVHLIGKNRLVGSSVQFRCNDPYEISNSAISKCVVTDDSPKPHWDPPLIPKCVIPECNGKIQTKMVPNSGFGEIVHPGYPAKMVLSGQHCIWQLKTMSNKRFIRLNIKFFSLPTKQNKKKPSSYLNIYDNSTDNLLVTLQSQESPRNITSSSSFLILELFTANISLKGNDAGGALGFLIEFESTCDVIEELDYGSVIGRDYSVGSNLSFSCDGGRDLVGNEVVTCLDDRKWSGSVPSCVVRNGGNKKNEPFIHQDTSSKSDDKLHSKKTGGDKNPTNPPNQTIPPSLISNPGEEEIDMPLYETDKTNDVPTLAIILGILIPLIVLLAILFGFLWYRRQHPVRIGFGRRFDVFENPAYEKKKKKSGGDDNAELQKLTSLPSN